MTNILQFPIPALPISQISPLPSATLSDIMLAVQSGSTGTETLQQVLSLFLPNLFFSFSGNPNGNLAGTTPQVCYDTLNRILWVCTSTGTTTSAVWNVANSYVNGIIPNDITSVTSVNMISNNSYVSDNSSSAIAYALPGVSKIGDLLYIVGRQNGWSISQMSGQQIFISPHVTTLGTGGSVSSTNPHDTLTLMCTKNSLEWTALGFTGNGLTIV